MSAGKSQEAATVNTTWVLEEQVLAPVAGLGEPHEPVLLGARGGEGAGPPRALARCHERLVAQVGVVGVVVVPGVVGERGLDDGQVVLVLGVKCLQRLEPVTVGSPSPASTGRTKRKLWATPRRGGWAGAPAGSGYRSRSQGTRIVGLDTVCAALIVHLEPRIATRPVGAPSPGHWPGRPARRRRGCCRWPRRYRAVFLEGEGGAHRCQRQSSAGGRRVRVCRPGELVQLPLSRKNSISLGLPLSQK